MAAISPPRSGAYMGRNPDAFTPPSQAADPTLEPWLRRQRQAEQDRRRYEPAWHLCQSFVQNRQWVSWDFRQSRVVETPNPQQRERHTTNVVTNYLYTVAGKLLQDDLQPDVQFRRQDVESQAYARQANRAVEFAWENEICAEEHISDAVLSMACYGTSGILCHPGPYGEKIGDLPVREDGRVEMDINLARQMVEQAFMAGGRIEMREVYEALLEWRTLSPFNILVPPGISSERHFPWLILQWPADLDDLAARFGDTAKGLREEKLRSIDLVGLRDPGSDTKSPQPGAELKNHVMLYTGFKMPTRELPRGLTVVWAQGRKLMEETQLPYKVGQRWHPGVVFFRYRKVPDRWWGLGVVEPLLSPQRQRNRARSQWIEMKDRAGLGRVFAKKNAIDQVTRPKGGVFETVVLRQNVNVREDIMETQGVSPGPWLQAEVEQNDRDMDLISGLREVSMGTSPAGVEAYAAFALLAEQDNRRQGPVLRHIRMQLAELTKITVAGMKRYWPPGKQIAVAGENDMMDVFVFNAAKLPDDVYVRVGTGAPLPKSVAAESQMALDIFDRSISSGQPMPIEWLYDSLTGGRIQPLPRKEMKVQVEKADLESQLIARTGMPAPVSPNDNDELHVMRHRAQQSQYQMIPGMEQVVEALEQHVQAHMWQAQMKAMQMMQLQAQGPGGGQPPSPLEGNGRDAGMGNMARAARQGV